MRLRSPRGFTLVELLIASAITLAILAAVLALTSPASEVFLVQPEVHDLQQRLRVAADTLQKDLLMAGAGLSSGPASGPLIRYFAPVLPYRAGDVAPDSVAGVFYRGDVVSLLYVPPTTAQAGVARITQAGGSLAIEARPNCGPLGRDRLCGFRTGMRVLIVDATGRFDVGTVEAVNGLTIQVQGRDLRGDEDPNELAAITEVMTSVYALANEAATGTPRLMRYDGRVTTFPAVDHVVTLAFEYFGEPAPPHVLAEGEMDGTSRTWASYGPAPPPVLQDRAGDAWGPGENCTFQVVNGAHAARLGALGPVGTLVRLDRAVLTDGPWCPDGNDSRRFDADLLRVRRIRVVLRTEAALASLRGRAGQFFVRAGSGTSARTLVPDQEIRFDVTPRNMRAAP